MGLCIYNYLQRLSMNVYCFSCKHLIIALRNHFKDRITGKGLGSSQIKVENTCPTVYTLIHSLQCLLYYPTSLVVPNIKRFALPHICLPYCPDHVPPIFLPTSSPSCSISSFCSLGFGKPETSPWLLGIHKINSELHGTILRGATCLYSGGPPPGTPLQIPGAQPACHTASRVVPVSSSQSQAQQVQLPRSGKGVLEIQLL